MYCKKCGKELNDNAAFCRYCGTKIKLDNKDNANKNTNVGESAVNESGSKLESERKVQIALIIGIGVAILIAIVIVVALMTGSISKDTASSDSSYSSTNNGTANSYNSNNYSNSTYVSNSTYSGNSTEYILPDSDKRIISRDELTKLNEQQVRMACNELYARHGRKFLDGNIQAYFNSKSWYRGTIEPEAFNEDVFNQYEKSNKDIIVMYEKEMHYNEHN